MPQAQLDCHQVSMSALLKLRYLAAEHLAMVKDWPKRSVPAAILLLALLHGALVLVLCGCTGNAERSRRLSSLRVELDSSPSSVEAAQHFPLQWSIQNLGRSAVDLCVQSETIGLRGSQGNRWPLLLGSTFDGCRTIHLASNEHCDFVFDALVFPTAPSGPATIFANVQLWIELGRWYRRGHLLPLSAERGVMVTRTKPSS
jgi:hypothetical protein